MRSTLSVADVAALMGWPARRAWRAIVRWERRGYPRVTREPGSGRGDAVRLRVDAAELDAVLAGRLSPLPVAS